MQDIEIKFHELLKDISGETYSSDEQAKIVAHASSLFLNKFKNKRLANKMASKILEAHMNDAVLKAMSSLDQWDGYSEEFIDCYGLSSHQTLRKVAQSTKNKWGNMEILNPDMLDYQEFDEDEHHEELENAQQTSEALKTPGIGRHRTDFQSSPNR